VDQWERGGRERVFVLPYLDLRCRCTNVAGNREGKEKREGKTEGRRKLKQTNPDWTRADSLGKTTAYGRPENGQIKRRDNKEKREEQTKFCSEMSAIE